MRSVVITGLGLCVPKFCCPNLLFDSLEQRKSLITFDKKLSQLGIKDIASGAMSDEEIAHLQAQYPDLCTSKVSASGFAAIHSMDKSIVDAKISSSALSKAGLFFGINKTLLSPDMLDILAQHTKLSSKCLESNKIPINESAEFYNPQHIVSHMSARLKNTGPISVIADACAAGAISLIAGYRRIAMGEIDVAVCGGADFGAQPTMQLLFKKIGALNNPQQELKANEVSRPFDKDRTGVVLSDGSAFLTLESEDHALSRGAKIYARLSGEHRCMESYRMTSTNSNGIYYSDVMKQAVANSGLQLDQIDHINAHGTSTKSNDLAESRAIHDTFGDKIPITSTKSATGHFLAGSGAIEAVLCALSLKNQLMLPTLNYSRFEDDEAHPINVVSKSTPAELNHILSNSFGFGGINASLVFSRFTQ